MQVQRVARGADGRCVEGERRKSAEDDHEHADREPAKQARAPGRPVDGGRREGRGRAVRRPPPEQPAPQHVQPPEVVHLIGDAAGLGGAEPRPFVLADQALERRPRLERHERPRQRHGAEHTLGVARRRLLEDQPAEVHQRQGEDVGEQQRPTQHRGPTRHVRVEDELGEEPAERADDEERGLEVVRRVVQELELLQRRDVG